MSLITSRAYPLAMQLTDPVGCWSSASYGRFGQDFCRRIASMRSDASCPPVDLNEVPQVVTTPGASGPRAGIHSSFTSAHLNPVGAVGIVVTVQSLESFGSRRNTMIVDCISPIAASTHIPQKMPASVHCIATPEKFSIVPACFDAA